jgi:hypothetical protein
MDHYQHLMTNSPAARLDLCLAYSRGLPWITQVLAGAETVAHPLSRFQSPGTVLGAQEIFTTMYCESLWKYFLGPGHIPEWGRDHARVDQAAQLRETAALFTARAPLTPDELAAVDAALADAEALVVPRLLNPGEWILKDECAGRTVMPTPASMSFSLPHTSKSSGHPARHRADRSAIQYWSA